MIMPCSYANSQRKHTPSKAYLTSCWLPRQKGTANCKTTSLGYSMNNNLSRPSHERKTLSGQCAISQIEKCHLLGRSCHSAIHDNEVFRYK
ncbi:unnamed protein product [Nezara viridula]|uniref:Uncharacterized protein n=1 Tax=Nezara viridula TaxID=85310 RepID=A0A9P0MXF2_NEZVI|nr:unnamed protein product [Nezara viridula]